MDLLEIKSMSKEEVLTAMGTNNLSQDEKATLLSRLMEIENVKPKSLQSMKKENEEVIKTAIYEWFKIGQNYPDNKPSLSLLDAMAAYTSVKIRFEVLDRKLKMDFEFFNNKHLIKKEVADAKG